jgi:hypothetical protein
MIIENIHKPLRYLLGPKFNKKIIVFESDDWGSIRMPNKTIRDKLIKRYPEINKNPFDLFDTLASSEDLYALFEVLNKYKDKKNNPVCITTNTIMANPDFDAIRRQNYKEFIYERFDKTLQRYYNDDSLALMKEGISRKFIFPQLHGREHLHGLQWLSELRKNNEDLKYAFDNYTYSVPLNVCHGYQRNNLASALNISGLKNENLYHEGYLRESVKLFNDFFGFPSTSFIATTYIWNKKHEIILANLGVKLFQGIGYQYSPVSMNKYNKIFHYTGQRNNLRQYYTVRNAFFEPSLNLSDDCVDDCLKRIEIAFKYKKPAIISSHRINFIGAIEEKNRTKNLMLLDELLKKVVAKWPDVEFYNTSELLNKFIS